MPLRRITRPDYGFCGKILRGCRRIKRYSAQLPTREREGRGGLTEYSDRSESGRDLSEPSPHRAYEAQRVGQAVERRAEPLAQFPEAVQIGEPPVDKRQRVGHFRR